MKPMRIGVASRIGQAGLLGLLAAAPALPGCGSGPEIGGSVYRGPSLSVDSSGDRHVVVAQAPSPGWDASIDHRRRAVDETRVFVTLRRPNPAAVYPQVIVEQRLKTGVRTSEPIGVYARELDFGTEDGKPYQPVEQN
jgi:hypothetical protein